MFVSCPSLHHNIKSHGVKETEITDQALAFISLFFYFKP